MRISASLQVEAQSGLQVQVDGCSIVAGIPRTVAVAMNWRDTVDAAKAAAFTARAVAAVAEPPADVAGAAVNATPLGTLSD